MNFSAAPSQKNINKTKLGVDVNLNILELPVKNEKFKLQRKPD